ncbi:metallophosphoesterase family protein [Shewanella litoralis]|uniref:Serine/threonine protein phosphatase n=1 Tax=Shewanella litoralis TaxID=2282700 RepID=A0ABQ2RL90_9GAMM|nr:metallophosphoesterase family protein [Shewanella litoralis]GGQ33891.1 serine/threonine protein phosphatase [Shewanella litoralis]
MKILIISDIHGNLPALEAVFNQVDINSFDRIISLGDVCGYYPFVNECLGLLKNYETELVIGNHDKYLLENTQCGRSTSANLLLDYHKEIISESSLDYLKTSKEYIVMDDIIFTHGSLDNYTEGYLYSIPPNYLQDYSFNRVFVGHTHVQSVLKLDDNKLFCNPGSVGQPRDGISTAAYAVINNGYIELHRADYDKQVLFAKMRSLGFEEYLYDCLNYGTRIGGKVDKIDLVENS